MTSEHPVPSNPVIPRADFDELADLVDEARALVVPRERRILGITGPPGSGKSTLADFLVIALGQDAVLVSMDGFHLDDPELIRMGRYARKGASDTFDAAGYVTLLRRLQDQLEPIVYAPRFERAAEKSIGSAVPVFSNTPLVITEGNYLLADQPDWRPVRALLDQCWYVDPDEDTRIQRLVARHISHGRSVEEAAERSQGSDGANAAIVSGTRHRATRIVRVPVLASNERVIG